MGAAKAVAGHPRVVYSKESCRGGNNSVVECDLANVEVAGSNPVSRSNIYRRSSLHPAWRGRDVGHWRAISRGARLVQGQLTSRRSRPSVAEGSHLFRLRPTLTSICT